MEEGKAGQDIEGEKEQDINNNIVDLATVIMSSHSGGSTAIPEAFIWPEAKAEAEAAAANQLAHDYNHHHHQYNGDENRYSGDDNHDHDHHQPLPPPPPAAFEIPSLDMEEARAAHTERRLLLAQAVVRHCKTMGFFQVVSHGLPSSLLQETHSCTQRFFDLPLSVKQCSPRLPGHSFGYSSSFVGRFSSRLPWKETFSLQSTPSSNIHQHIDTTLGDPHASLIFENYCQAMVKLGLEILEILELGLGLEPNAIKKYFTDNSSILRLNNYPPCQQPSLTYGTGPHTDPTGLTILHQDEVPGLQVFHDEAWHTIPPNKEAFVINIGDTLMALSNKHYKSCLHRALVNSMKARQSITFFFNPAFHIVLSPPEELVDDENPRAYQDFTWAKFLYFTQCIHRSGNNSMDHFNKWLIAQSEKL